jgi:SAM-dependent methyltransferase
LPYAAAVAAPGTLLRARGRHLEAATYETGYQQVSTQADGNRPERPSAAPSTRLNHPIARRDRFVADQLDELPAGALVVNVGCGTVRRFESERPRYLATDIRQLPSVDFVSDVTALPLAGGTADAVVALELIEHVPDPRAALEELRRAVKPGGLIIVSVPSTVPRHDVHDYWRFTAEGLAQLGSDVLGVGDVHVFGGTFETIGTIVQYYLALVLHRFRIPSWTVGRVFPSIGYWLDRHNRWSTSATDLHTLAFDLLLVATAQDVPASPGPAARSA